MSSKIFSPGVYPTGYFEEAVLFGFSVSSANPPFRFVIFSRKLGTVHSTPWPALGRVRPIVRTPEQKKQSEHQEKNLSSADYFFHLFSLHRLIELFRTLFRGCSFPGRPLPSIFPWNSHGPGLQRSAPSPKDRYPFLSLHALDGSGQAPRVPVAWSNGESPHRFPAT